MKIDRVTIRLAAPLRLAAEKLAKAAGLTLGEWIRSLIESATGEHYDHPQGFAAMSARQRKAAQRASLETRRARAGQGGSDE